MRERRPEPTPRAVAVTLALWWIALYLTIIYLAIRLGAHPALSDVG